MLIGYRSGVFVLLTMALTMLLSGLGFWVDVAPSLGLLIAAMGLSGALIIALSLRARLQGEGLKRCLLESGASILLGVAIGVLCCWVATHFYDLSYDGNSYHKLAVVALRDGWNPLAESIVDWPRYEEIYTYQTRIPLWLDHYANGLWAFSACLYDATGSLEQAKSYTLMAMYAVASILQFLLWRKGLRVWQSVGIALIAVANPITLSQFTTFYCDAYLMMALGALLCGLCMLADSRFEGHRASSFVIIASAFLCCAGTKFTGLAYAGLFVIAFCVVYIWRWHRREAGFSTLQLVQTAVVFLAMLLVAVFVCNFTSYVLNFLEDGNPFFPLMGEGKVDIMTAQTPAPFAGASTVERLFYSLFSQTGNIYAESGEAPVLKIPLSFSDSELAALRAPDLRMGGFGIFYSAAFIIGAVAFLVLLVSSFKRDKLLFECAMAYALPTMAMLLLLEDSWWARYSSYLYFVNVFVLGWLCSIANGKGETRSWGAKVAAAGGAVLALILVMNAAAFVRWGVLSTYEITCNIRDDQAAIKGRLDSGSESLSVAYEDMPGGIYLPGELYTLEDEGIPYSNEGVETEEFVPDGSVNYLLYRFVPSDERQA